MEVINLTLPANKQDHQSSHFIPPWKNCFVSCLAKQLLFFAFHEIPFALRKFSLTAYLHFSLSSYLPQKVENPSIYEFFLRWQLSRNIWGQYSIKFLMNIIWNIYTWNHSKKCLSVFAYHRSYLRYRMVLSKSHNLNHHCTLQIKYSFILKLFWSKKLMDVFSKDFGARWTNVFGIVYMDLHNQCRPLLDSLFHPNKYLQVFWYQWSRYIKLNLFR